MTDEERNAIVRYRMENARRTLNEIAIIVREDIGILRLIECIMLVFMLQVHC